MQPPVQGSLPHLRGSPRGQPAVGSWEADLPPLSSTRASSPQLMRGWTPGAAPRARHKDAKKDEWGDWDMESQA